MHTSRLSTFVIDCQTDNLPAAAEFWAKALRRGLKVPAADDNLYRDLTCAPSEPLLMIQKVKHDSRIHLDIEADDIDAEVARLEMLGATIVDRVKTWVVMQAPTGQKFCVVRPQRPASTPAFPRATAQHATLAKFVGHYRGTVKLWMDPSAPPDVSEGELSVQAVFGGRWLRIEQLGKVGNKAHAGEMLLGYNIDEAQYELCWVDSFHTGSAMMNSIGKHRDDGVVSVLGSFAAGPERWGWRTEFSRGAGGTVVIRAFNISPAGEDSLAMESEWRALA